MNQPDLQKIWGDLNWEKTDISVLKKQIQNRQEQGIDINQKAERFVQEGKNPIWKKEEYTLMDLLRERRQFTPPKQAQHWNEVMNLMREMGAKCACALQYPKTPAQKILDELSAVKHHEKILLQQLQKLRQRSK